jgi:hypothetical protein
VTRNREMSVAAVGCARTYSMAFIGGAGKRGQL